MFLLDITVASAQVKSPRAIELDKLVERMTEFYSEDSNREMYKLQKVFTPVICLQLMRIKTLQSWRLQAEDCIAL